jgi:Tol biopolymer transport system component
MHNFALSPDGRTLAVVVGLGGTRGLYLRELSDIEFRVLAGSEGAASPFWSPDGSELAFFAGGKLKRVAREGGPVQVVCEVQGSNTGAWGRGGTILFSQGFGPDNGLFRVAAAGGAPVRLESAADLPRWMELLPDGRRFLYWDRADDALSGKVYLADLETGESRLLLDVTSQVRYAPAGWLVYVRDEALVAQRFDAERGEVTGDPIALAANVAHFFNGWAALSVAGPAALAYQVDAPPQPLLWLDRHGRDIGRVGPVARAISARLSPDGQSAAVVWSDPASTFTDLWIVDLVRGGATRVSEEALLAWSPVWSPEGDRVAYTATSPGPEFKVVVRRVSDGETLASLPAHDNFFWPRGWGPAGIFLDRNQGRTRWDLWRWPALEAEAGPLLETEFNETLGSPSPDGRWLALHSLESGEGEIELLPLRSPGRRVRVSRGAQGVVPRWSGDGRELFFVSAEGWLSVVSIGTGDSPIISEPEPLFEIELVNETAIDVSADGERFLVAATTPNSALPITVALDWQGDLPRP